MSYRDYMDLAVSLSPIHLWDFCPEGGADNWAVNMITTATQGTTEIPTSSGGVGVVPDLGSLGDDMATASLVSTTETDPSGTACAFEFTEIGDDSRCTTLVERDENLLYSDFSLIIWVNLDSLVLDNTFHSIFINQVNCPGSQFSWGICMSADDIVARIFNGGIGTYLDARVPNATTSAGVWYFIGARFDDTADDLFIYRDGPEVGSDTTPSGSRGTISAKNVRIGDICFPYTGLVTGPGMFDYQLDPSDFQDLYDAMLA